MSNKVNEPGGRKPRGRNRGRFRVNGLTNNAMVKTYAEPIGAGFLEGAIEAKLGFYAGLAPEAKAIVLLLLGIFAIRKGRQTLGGALLALAGRYGAQRILGPKLAGLADASDAELEAVSEQYGLGDADDDVIDAEAVGALPGDDELGALPGDESLDDAEAYDDDYAA